ncbi:cytochrome c [Limimaricola variabilis]|uniref:Cytochrome c n=1 Tax=Limimaricola variabilis TaxID=1492771 RepID=A0ABR6HL23_9RHOB|nr:cytochrome C [Limimaricola variabilis]MBB3711240.1 cytochrome c [Limimaricola variabilis]
MDLLSRGAALALAGLGLGAAPVAAQDIANGELQFGRQCVACHVVRDEDGRVLAGRNARTGPNLHGLEGRKLGSVEGFRYGDAITALGERGVEWNEERFVAYVMDPTAWLRAELDDRRARGKMAYRVRDAKDAADIYAYLTGLAPAESAEAQQ